MCHVVIFLVLVRSTFPFFCISGKLWSCSVSKPSVSSLVGQIVCLQDLRCPFLVISGGSECYHNPSLSLFPSLSHSLFPVDHLKSPSAAWCKSFIYVLQHDLVVLLLFPFLYICASHTLCVLLWLFFSVHVALCSPPLHYGLPCGLTVVWHSVWVIGLLEMLCKESLSSSKTLNREAVVLH